jgi:hypothetical protein
MELQNARETIRKAYMLDDLLSQTIKGSDEWRKDDERLRRLSDLNM